MQLASDMHVSDGFLATLTLLSEKPHHGVTSSHAAPLQGIDGRNSTAVLSLRSRCHENASGTVVAPNNGNSSLHNTCVGNAVLKGALTTGFDALGLLPEAGGVTRLIGNSFGYRGVVANQRAARIIKGASYSFSSVSLLSGGVGGSLFDSPLDALSTVSTVAGFIPGLGQAAAIVNVGIDIYKTAKAVQACPQ